MKADELTPVDVAKALGVGRLYLYELLASGRITGRKILGRWVIHRSAIEAYRRAHPRRDAARANG